MAYVYVDTDVSGGSNDGSSWENAYSNLATAIADNGVDFSVFGESKHFLLRASSNTKDSSRSLIVDTDYTNSDATNHIIIEQVDDHQGLFDNTGYSLNGAPPSSGDNIVIKIDDVSYVEFIGLRYYGDIRANWDWSILFGLSDIQTIIFKDCIFCNTSGTVSNGPRTLFQLSSAYSTTSLQLVNCLMVGFGAPIQYGSSGQNNSLLMYNTMAFDGTGYCLVYSSGVPTVESIINCYFANTGTSSFNFGGSVNPVLTNTYTDDGDEGTSIIAYSDTGGSWFESISEFNFHIQETSEFVGQATDLSGDSEYSFSYDFEGDTRISWDVGPDEWKYTPPPSPEDPELDVTHLETIATDFRTYLLNNLGAYLTAAETDIGDDVELPMVEGADFVIGDMDIDKYTNTPTFFLMPDIYEYVIDEETPLNYETVVQEANLYIIVSKAKTTILHTQAIRYAGVIKKLIIENNTLGNLVDYVEIESIQMFEGVEASDNKKAIKIKIRIHKEIEVS